MFQSNRVFYDIESARKRFQDRGVVRLEQLIPAAKVASACKAAQNRMERAGIWKDGAWQIDHLCTHAWSWRVGRCRSRIRVACRRGEAMRVLNGQFLVAAGSIAIRFLYA
jgi:uncharacterized protein YjlB